MLIDFKDIRVGDEIIIPSNSNIKYLKVISKTKSGQSLKCSIGEGITGKGAYGRGRYYCETDVSKHNAIFYLRDDNGYRDIWLVKREDYD